MKHNEHEMNLYLSLLKKYFFNTYHAIPYIQKGKHGVLRCKENEEEVALRKHLTTDYKVGVLNIDEDGYTKWGAFDLDGPEWEKAKKKHKHPLENPLQAAFLIYNISINMGLRPYVEVSASGTGFHIWYFFENRKRAREVKKVLQNIVPKDIPLLDGGFACVKAGKGVEVFPKQEGKSDGIGNHVWAPFHATPERPIGSKFVVITNKGTYAYCPLSFEYTPEYAWNSLVAELDIKETNKIIPQKKRLTKIKNNFSRYPRNQLSNVFRGCNALRRLGNRGKAEQPSHHEGLALLSIMKCFSGGLEEFCKNIKGWATNDKEIDQINNFAEKYGPYSCQKLQELGLCDKPSANSCMYHDSPNPIHLRHTGKSLKQDINKILSQIKETQND